MSEGEPRTFNHHRTKDDLQTALSVFATVLWGNTHARRIYSGPKIPPVSYHFGVFQIQPMNMLTDRPRGRDDRVNGRRIFVLERICGILANGLREIATVNVEQV